MKISIEIRPGEGGDDAKMLVADQAAIYLNYAAQRGFTAQIVDEEHG